MTHYARKLATFIVSLALQIAALSFFTTAAVADPTQQAYVKAFYPEPAQFGTSVAISGNMMVVGAPQERSGATGVNGDETDLSEPLSGAAYVFVRQGSNWIQQAYLKASNTGGDPIHQYSGDMFGSSVAVSGDIVVVGAPGESSNATGINGNQSDDSAAHSGAVYIFVRNGTNWSQQAYVKASNTAAGDGFGQSVAVSGEIVIVGAAWESNSAIGVNGPQGLGGAPASGAAYIFVRTGTNWSQEAYLKASNAEESDLFGYSVAASGDSVIVGAYGEDSKSVGVNGDQHDNSASYSGAVYVFVRHGSNWSQQAYLKASNAGLHFGRSVSMSGDTVVVGAWWEASNATGVNGDQSNNSSREAGAAYVFVRDGTNWSQQAYLKASNTQTGDRFGSSVAVSGDLAIVGAENEASKATGINGDQSDNSQGQAGAAYVFLRRRMTWTQQAYVKASNTKFGSAFSHSVAASGDTVVSCAPFEGTFSGAAYVYTGFDNGPKLHLDADGNGGYLVRISGVPDVTYYLQRASDLPGNWDTIATLTGPLSGVIEFHDTAPLTGRAFYRTVQP